MNKPMTESAAMHALAAILKQTPSWNPREGDTLSVSCSTSYVLSPCPLDFRLTEDVIDMARAISGIRETKEELAWP